MYANEHSPWLNERNKDILTLTGFLYLHLFIVLSDEGDGSNLESCDIAGLVEDMEIVVRWHSVDRSLTSQL